MVNISNEKGRISIRLYGNEGYNPDIKWLTNESGENGDICRLDHYAMPTYDCIYTDCRKYNNS